MCHATVGTKKELNVWEPILNIDKEDLCAYCILSSGYHAYRCLPLTYLHEAKFSVATLDKKFAWRRERRLGLACVQGLQGPRSEIQKGLSLDSLQQIKREKWGPQDCCEKQRSDGFEQLWSLSHFMEVKRGPWPRSWRKVSMDATPECCERPWMCSGNNL